MRNSITVVGSARSNDHQRSSITRDEWMHAVSEAGYVLDVDNDPQAITVNDFMAMFTPPLTRRAAENRLEVMIRAGKVRRTQKLGTDSFGRTRRYVAYRLIDAPA